MASTSDIRKGLCIKYNHDIYKIIEFLHVKPGKGPAFVRTKLKSVTNGKVIDNTFPSGHKIEEVKVVTSQYQYLYNDSDYFHFMNNDDYNQITIDKNKIDYPDLLKEGENVTIIMFLSPMLRKYYYLLCMWALALGPYAGGAGGAAPRWCCLIKCINSIIHG